jgi:hypothetical protein
MHVSLVHMSVRRGGGAVVVAIVGALYQRLRPKSHPASKQASISGTGNALMVAESPGGVSVLAPISNSPIAVGQNVSQSVEVHHHYERPGQLGELLQTRPTPAEIFDELKSVMPFDLHHSREKYRGLSVTWKVILGAVSARDRTWFITAWFGATSGTAVGFSLSSVPPDLRAANAGATFWVLGSISRVWELGIFLENDPTILRVEHS